MRRMRKKRKTERRGEEKEIERKRGKKIKREKERVREKQGRGSNYQRERNAGRRLFLSVGRNADKGPLIPADSGVAFGTF